MKLLPEHIFFSTRLSEYVEHYSQYLIKHTLRAPLLHMPLGTVQIIFQLDSDIYHNTNFTNEWEQRPNAFVGGPYNAAYQMKLNSCTRIFSVLLKPGRAFYFFPFPMYEIMNQTVSPEEIWGGAGKKLKEQIFTAKTNRERVEVMEAFLLLQLKEKTNSRIEPIVQKMMNAEGRGKIKEWANEANFSQSHFRKTFREQVGLSPKEFQKIVRLNAVVNNGKLNFPGKLTDLCYQYEFYDQSHFIKEFKEMTNYTPRQVFANSCATYPFSV